MTGAGEAPFLPEGVDADGGLVSTQRTIFLENTTGSHNGHTLNLMEDLGDDRWRCVCSCGEWCVLTIDSYGETT